jgi:hypothetical protein
MLSKTSAFREYVAAIRVANLAFGSRLEPTVSLNHKWYFYRSPGLRKRTYRTIFCIGENKNRLRNSITDGLGNEKTLGS